MRSKRQKTIIIGVLSISLLSATIFITRYLAQNDDTSARKSQASNVINDDCGRITQIGVSTDGINPSGRIDLNLDSKTYYVHILNSEKRKANCSTQLDVLIGNSTVQKWQSPQWGVYKTNRDGVARIDFEGVPAGTYRASFKPHGKNVSYSSQVVINISSQRDATTNTTFDPSDYLVFNPGTTYIYETYNRSTNRRDVTRMQIEEPRDWCGIPAKVLRFTKDNESAYWNPKFTPTTPSNMQLRWFVRDNSRPGQNPFPNTTYALGDKRYVMRNSRDINPADFMYITKYTATEGSLPAYTMHKAGTQPGDRYDVLNTKFHTSNVATACPELQNTSLRNTANLDAWKVRYELEDINLNKNGLDYKYQGQALRIDFYEGKTPLSLGQSQMFRESWYFAKDVGLVMIKVKNFNNYGNTCGHGNAALCNRCDGDPDCNNNQFVNPDVTVTLNKYFKNERLNIRVSSTDTGYNNASTVANATKRQGYYLYAMTQDSKPYTGYLSFKNQTGTGKWFWVENGKTRLTSQDLQSLPPGQYRAQFKVWVPNESFPGEVVRPASSNNKWSNDITINLSN